jgi:alpha-1,6-mannosyltransferase
MLEQRSRHYLLAFLSLVLYIAMAYAIERHETAALFACYFALFALYLIMIRRVPLMESGELKFWTLVSIVFRLSVIFSIPALSDDFYRFIWDGRLLAAGIHPFAEVPSYYMTAEHSITALDAELFNKLNSRETYTIYPPFAQLIFWLSVVGSDGSIYGSMLVMKIVIFFFELGTLWIFPGILRQFKQAPAGVLIYALNPLAILELTGNLHFEGIMIFFFLTGIFFLRKQQRLASSITYALSICTKLIPLIFLPLMARHIGWKKAIVYGLLTGGITLLLFAPLLTEDIVHGLSTSLRYYFQRFEFNASVYYLLRSAGYLLFGFNIIQFSGPVLGLMATLIILMISFRNLPKRFPDALDAGIFRQMLWCLLAYFLLTTILHPWYIITLLAICIFTPYRFPVIWTGVIFLTYEGYTTSGYNENLLLIAFEYLVVTAYLLYETVWTKRRNLS